MDLVLNRKPSFKGATISPLFLNGVFECYVLEDEIREVAGKPVKDWKVDKVTAIPAGKYQVIIDFSTRFQRLLPLLVDVDGYKGIRIHAGNTAADTDGCLIVGQKPTDIGIVGGTSKPALAALQAKIQAAIDAGEKVFITIKNPVATTAAAPVTADNKAIKNSNVKTQKV